MTTLETILNSMKCANCRERLSTPPILLPCGHLICQLHSETSDKPIVCSCCGTRHHKKGILVVTSIEDLKNAKLTTFDCGSKRDATAKSLSSFSRLLDDNELMLADLEYFVAEKMRDLKNKVFLKREELKLEIDKRCEEIVVDIEAYQKKCAENLKSDELKSNRAEFERLNNECKARRDEWSKQLDELRVEEKQLKEVQNECDSNVGVLREKLDSFLDELFMGQLDCYTQKSEFFDEINSFAIPGFNPVDFSKSSNSKILTIKQKNTLFELIKVNIESIEMNLLYRGSQDGFRANDFHRRCDNNSRTLTVVETTKGHIFGGFTYARWSSRGGWRKDPDVFLFSLVNKFKRPFTTKFIASFDGIHCAPDRGPYMGSHNRGCYISVGDWCNQTLSSFARLASVRVFDDLIDPDGIYFSDTFYFQVKEIEVFKLEWE